MARILPAPWNQRSAPPKSPEESAAVAVGMMPEDGPLPKVPPLRWGDTCLPLPNVLHGTYRDALTGRAVESRLGRLDLSDVLASFPAAVLVKT